MIRSEIADTERCCLLCRYYSPIGGLEGEDRGHCRQGPPAVTAEGSSWPVVAEEDWCGAFKQADSAQTMSVPEAGAKFYGLSRQGSYNAANRGDIPTIRVGRLRRVPVAKLMQMVAR